MEKNRFFLMKDLYDILYHNYQFNQDNIIEYLDSKSTNQLGDMLHYLMYDNTSDIDNKVIKDFAIWEDEHITKIELLENMLDYGNYNIIEIVQFLNTLDISDRDYYCNYCIIDDICEEFERWRSKNELSQNN